MSNLVFIRNVEALPSPGPDIGVGVEVACNVAFHGRVGGSTAPAGLPSVSLLGRVGLPQASQGRGPGYALGGPFPVFRSRVGLTEQRMGV